MGICYTAVNSHTYICKYCSATLCKFRGGRGTAMSLWSLCAVMLVFICSSCKVIVCIRHVKACRVFFNCLCICAYYGSIVILFK